MVPVCLLLFGFVSKEATAFSNIIALFLSLIKIVFSINKKDPKKPNKTLIEYNICLILNPSIILANLVASFINEILPSGVILVGLMMAIILAICLNLRDGIRKYRKETKINKFEKSKSKYDIETVYYCDSKKQNESNSVIIYFY